MASGEVHSHAHSVEGATTAGFARLRESSTETGAAPNYDDVIKELRMNHENGKPRDLAWRRQQLKALQKMIADNHLEITAAVRADHGGAKLRGLAELGAHQAADEALNNLEAWTAPQKVATPFQVSPTMMASSYIRPEGKGVVLIIGPWNFPFELVIHPLVSAIAAGNCVCIKPSEVAKNTGALVEKLINKYLDTSCIKVVQGAVAETQALLALRWDHIFYTGNGHVGRIVLRAAAEHLTPVTLELGGKSPVIVDKSAKMESVVGRVSAAKWLNVGQICVAPDYVVIDKSREQEFIDGMKKAIADHYGKDPKKSPDFGRVINSNHVNRISGLLKGTQGKVVTGGLDYVDASQNYFPPTIVQGAKLGEPLLTEEIFGPVLPVVAVDNLDKAIDAVNSICDRPLALYVYSEDKNATEKVLAETMSGGACINDSLNHLLNSNLPFGGVGGSGYGSYHGKAGFDEFTHKRSVLHQDTMIKKSANLPPPPYKDGLYDIAVKATVTGFLTEDQKHKAKLALGAGAAAVAGMLLRSKL